MDLSKETSLFEFIQNPDTIDKIALGLENDCKFTVRSTLQLLNQILREYSKDGSNKLTNISAISEEEEKEHWSLDYENMKVENENDPNLNLEHQLLDDEVNTKGWDSFTKSKEEENLPLVTECDQQFINSVSTLLPLVSSFLKEN